MNGRVQLYKQDFLRRYIHLGINFLEKKKKKTDFRQQLKIDCSCSCQDMQAHWSISRGGTQWGSEYSYSKVSFFWSPHLQNIFQALCLYLLMVS